MNQVNVNLWPCQSNKICPICHETTIYTAITKLVYTWQPCYCEGKGGKHGHLYEQGHHRTCFEQALKESKGEA